MLLNQNLNRELQDKEKFVDTLQNQVNEQKDRIANFEKDAQSAKSIQAKMVGKLDEMKEEIYKATATIQKLTEKMKTYKEKVKSKTEVIKNMNDAIEHEKAIKSQLERRTKELERVAGRQTEEQKEAEMKVGELKQKL
jgi:DNA repair ATPase RecN